VLANFGVPLSYRNYLAEATPTTPPPVAPNARLARALHFPFPACPPAVLARPCCAAQ